MKKWAQRNKQFKEISEADQLAQCLVPFRSALQTTKEKLNTENLHTAYREVRAKMINDLRVSLALLDAAAYEEEILIKK